MRTRYLRRQAIKRELHEFWLLATNKYSLALLFITMALVLLDSFK